MFRYKMSIDICKDAALERCKRRGEDPDEVMYLLQSSQTGVIVECKRWAVSKNRKEIPLLRRYTKKSEYKVNIPNLYSNFL